MNSLKLLCGDFSHQHYGRNHLISLPCFVLFINHSTPVYNARSIFTEVNSMNILKTNVAVFSSLLLLLFAVVDAAAGKQKAAFDHELLSAPLTAD